MTAPKSNKRGRAALVVVLCLLALCLAAGGTVYGLLSRKVKAIQAGADFDFRYTVTSTASRTPALYGVLEQVGATQGTVSGQYAPGRFQFTLTSQKNSSAFTRVYIDTNETLYDAGQQQAVAGQGVLHCLFGVAQLDPAHPGSGAGQTFNVFGLCHGRLRVGAHPRHGDHNTHIQLPHCLQPLPANAESGCLCKKRGIARSAKGSPFGRTVCEADEEGRPADR